MIYHGNMRYYNVREVATMLSLSYGYVRMLIEAGKLEAVNVGLRSEKIWRISEAELERFKKTNSNINKGEK